MQLGRSVGGKYLGDEISAGDWASRHDRYAIPLHGRSLDGQAVPMSWHCEDAALNYSVLPQVREEWHAIVARYRERYGIFDDWGMFAYTNGPYKPWADYLVEIDVGIWEQRLDEESGRRGSTASARSPRSRSRTAARSRRATARRGRATPSWCRPRWAARGRS